VNHALEIHGQTPPRAALPDPAAGADIGLAPRSKDAAAPGKGRVLLLEDDTAFAESITAFLAESGYTVVAVQSGVEGIRAVLAGDFTVILCDMMMPTVPGEMFYEAVKRSCPQLCRRFIFMTGHRGDGRANDFLKSINGFVLRKPFRLEDLRDAICLAEVRGTYRSVFESGITERVVAEARRAVAGGTSRLERSKVAPTIPAPLPHMEAAPPAQEPTIERPVVIPQRQGVRAIVGASLLLLALAMVSAAWHFALRERTSALSGELGALEMQWAVVSKRRQAAEAARATSEVSLQQAKSLAGERVAPRWAAALRSMATAVSDGIALQHVQARGEAEDPGACDLRIDGVCTGREPRSTADQFRQLLETNLRQLLGRDGMTARFERLEEDTDSTSASPDVRRAAFTIVAATGAKEPGREKTEGR
jgi:CheY-like chemotaxis protein